MFMTVPFSTQDGRVGAAMIVTYFRFPKAPSSAPIIRKQHRNSSAHVALIAKMYLADQKADEVLFDFIRLNNENSNLRDMKLFSFI